MCCCVLCTASCTIIMHCNQSLSVTCAKESSVCKSSGEKAENLILERTLSGSMMITYSERRRCRGCAIRSITLQARRTLQVRYLPRYRMIVWGSDDGQRREVKQGESQQVMMNQRPLLFHDLDTKTLDRVPRSLGCSIGPFLDGGQSFRYASTSLLHTRL